MNTDRNGMVGGGSPTLVRTCPHLSLVLLLRRLLLQIPPFLARKATWLALARTRRPNISINNDLATDQSSLVCCDLRGKRDLSFDSGRLFELVTRPTL